jgi:HSP20 family molecular chaperone IbpA
MMSRLNVKKIPVPSDRGLPIFEEFDRLADRIRVEAYNLFTGRGAIEGHDLDDWLAAERGLCGPDVEVAEQKAEFVLNLALDGFDPVDIEVTATPREILIKGEHVLRRVELPAAVEVDRITAKLQNGVLKIVAPKTAVETDATKRIDVAKRAGTRSRQSEAPPRA